MRNIVILISGSGSNMAAIAQAAQAEDWAHKPQAHVCAVISSRPEAKGLQMAADLGLPTQVVSHQNYAAQADPRARGANPRVLQRPVGHHRGKDRSRGVGRCGR